MFSIPTTMFGNALIDSNKKPALTLFKPIGHAKWNSERDVRRAIDRWQTKAFVQAAMAALGVQNTYQLERCVMCGDLKQTFPLDRPHLFDRMARLGEPDIKKHIAVPGRKQGLWLQKLLQAAPNARDVLEEPIWRLLDPKPLQYVELCALDEAYVKIARSSHPAASDFEVLANTRGLKADLFPLLGRSRLLLTEHLLSMRWWEIKLDLRGYYIFLLQAVRTCREMDSAADLALLGPTCGDFLAQSFGRVNIGFPEHPETRNDCLWFAVDAIEYLTFESPNEDTSCLLEILRHAL